MTRKTLMLLNAHYPADIRVKKEADALINAGLDVHLLCLRRKGESYNEEYQAIKIFRIDAGKNNYVLAFWDVVMSITFIHPRFKKAAYGMIEKYGIEALHVHDLPLAGTALSIKKEKAIKVIVDLHENYPEALKTWFKWKKNPIARMKNILFLNPKRWTKYEQKACTESDKVIAVVDEMKQRLISNYNIESHKISVITNTEDKEFINQELDPNVYKEISKGFIVAYCGGIGPHRGVDTAIQAMSLLKKYDDINLVIVGSGSISVMKNLKSLVKSLNLKNVHFLGYQPFSKFYSYMKYAHINIIPHHSNGHTDNTVPHKLFQGMMAGRPLLVSSCKPLKRIVESCKSGLVFEAGSPDKCAQAMKELYSNEQLRAELGGNGVKATIEGALNWENTQQELIHLYDLV